MAETSAAVRSLLIEAECFISNHACDRAVVRADFATEVLVARLRSAAESLKKEQPTTE